MIGISTKAYNLPVQDPLREALEKGWVKVSYHTAQKITRLNPQGVIGSVSDEDVWSGPGDVFPQKIQNIQVSSAGKDIFIDSVAMDLFATDYADNNGWAPWSVVYNAGVAIYESANPTLLDKSFEEWITEIISQTSISGAPIGFKHLRFTQKIPHVTKDFSLTTDPALFTLYSTMFPIANEEFHLNFSGRPLETEYQQLIAPDAVSELQLPNFYKNNEGIKDEAWLQNVVDSLVVGTSPGVSMPQENVIFPMSIYEDLMALNVNNYTWPLENEVSPCGNLWYQNSYFETAFRNVPGGGLTYHANVGNFGFDLVAMQTVMLYAEAEAAATSNSDLRDRIFAIPQHDYALQRVVDQETLDVVSTSYVMNVGAGGHSFHSTNQLTENLTVNVATLDLEDWISNFGDILETIQSSSQLDRSFLPNDDGKITMPNDSWEVLEDATYDVVTLDWNIDDFWANITELLQNGQYSELAGSPPSSMQDFIKSYADITRDFWASTGTDTSYSEIIFYKVEKRADPNSLIPIQTFWIPAMASLTSGELVHYIDTQVKFGKNYFYSVSAYSIVVGTKYYYGYNYPADYLAQATTIPPDEDYCPEAPTGWEGIAYAALFEPHYHNIYSWATGRAVVPSSNFGGYSLATFDHDHHFDGATTPNQDPASTTAWNGDSGDIILDAASLQLFLSIQAGTTTVSGYGGAVQLTGRTMGVNVSSTGGGAVVDHYHRVSISVGDQSLPGDGATDMDDICHGTWGSGETTIPAGTTSILHKGAIASFDVVTAPTVQLIQTHLFDFNGATLSLPPTAPDVFFIPYIGIDNEITLSMHAQLGEYQKEAVILDSADADYIDALRTSYGLSPTDPIAYKTDDEVAGFEIYRTETKPSTYEDFSGKFINSISTLQRSSFEYVYAWDTAYKDKIVPNKVYYYMVRTVDIHGQKSYPSAVFQVQMVNDSGAIYPLIEVIDLVPPPKPQSKTKNFKKFLQLVPSIAQRMINYDESGLTDSAGRIVNSAVGKHTGIVLGVKNPSLFGGYYSSAVVGGADHAQYIPSKRLKIRLISKQTGKKIDLNVAFKVENE